MRLTQNKIEEITLPILNEEGLPLIKQLYGKENVSEFDLAKKTKLDIKVVRKMLYLLYNNNLVGFNRKKDKEKGWYIYYWTIIPDNVRFIYFKRKREQLVRLKERLESEEKELFFICPKECVRLNFDQGMDFEFHCPECGELLTQDESNVKNISVINSRIKKLEEEIENEKRIVRRALVKEKKRIAKEQTKAKRKETKKKVVKKKPVKKKAVKKKTSTKKKAVKKKVKTVKKSTKKKVKK
jgi:transcription initiation factor TFIIE subunit alpha